MPFLIFHAYASVCVCGGCVCSTVPAPAVEYKRARLVRSLHRAFVQLCQSELNITPPRIVFFRWLMEMATCKGKGTDPILRLEQRTCFCVCRVCIDSLLFFFFCSLACSLPPCSHSVLPPPP